MYKVVKNDETVFVGITESSAINAYAHAVHEIIKGGETFLLYRDDVDEEFRIVAFRRIPYAVQSSEKR